MLLEGPMEKNQTTRLKKGVKRLSLICGGLGAAIWGFLIFMEIIHFRYGSDGKIIMGFLFSFFLPWGILRAIPWVMEGFNKDADVRYSQDEIEKIRTASSIDNPICPICNSNLVKAIIEEDGHGDWCYNCKKSLQKMQEEVNQITNTTINQATNNGDSTTEAFPADTPSNYHPQFNSMDVRLDATEKKLKKMQFIMGIYVCLLILCLTITINLLYSKKQSRYQVLMAEGLIINDKFGITRIEINTRRISNKPYIDFLNDKGEYVNSIDETGHRVDVKSYIERFDPPKTQVMPTYEELMGSPDAKLRKSVPFEPDKFIPDPQKKKLPAWEETVPLK
jgi:hypothetical protein